MRRIWTVVKEKFNRAPASLRIIFTYNIVNIFIALLFYPLIPILLNYPPGTVNTKFQVDIDGLTYTQQYFLIVLIAIILGFAFVKFTLRGIDSWEHLLVENSNEKEKIYKIRKKCFNLPYTIYVVQVLFPAIVVIALLTMIKVNYILTLRLSIIVFTFTTLAALISYIFSKRIFTQILFKTYQGESVEGTRIGIRANVFLQILPMLIVAIFFTSLVAYSRLIEEKGNVYFESYKGQLENEFHDIGPIKDISKIKEILGDIYLRGNNITKFVITPEGQVVTLDNSKLSDTFVKYINELSSKYEDRVYGYDDDTQGAIVKLKGQNRDWVVGVRYDVASSQSLYFFIVSFIILLSLNALVLSYFSRAVSEDIGLVARRLSEIAEGEDIENIKPLSVTSNDEIGDLVLAFNKIQDLERKQIEEIRNTQKQLTERERLASLGELAGGVAHDINSPLSAIQTGQTLIDRLTHRCYSLLGEENLSEEVKKCFKDIDNCIQTNNNACQKIVKIVNSVRNHTRNLSGETIQDFYVKDVVEDLKILLNHQLKQNSCELNIVQEEKQLVKGDPGKLSQVLTNLITNAMQAYKGSSGMVEVNIGRKDNNAIIKVKDNAGGIPKEFREGIFKNILTTKGTQGTGLGLYLSYSIITGHFGGDMWFESEEEQGTTFFISIPIKQIKNN